MSVEGRPLDDRELIERAKEGDADAYAVLVERYQGVAYRTAYVVAGSSADAEDAAQDAFVKAYYALNRFLPDAPFRPWLLKIVANEARNRRRAGSRREGLALRLAQIGPSGGAAPSPEVTALDRARREELLKAINELREDDRLILAYRYFLDLSEAEMATVMACRPGTVKSRLSRALARLRLQMETRDGVTP
jgi:RNA polymerase sigma-70 factor (ECF subfamily)